LTNCTLSQRLGKALSGLRRESAVALFGVDQLPGACDCCGVSFGLHPNLTPRPFARLGGRSLHSASVCYRIISP